MSGATTTKPSAVSTSNSQLKVKCYLSFDDGPNANTGTILDVLAAEHVKATFYLTGKNLKSVPDLQYKLVRRMINEGHDLGNHGYDHDPMMRRDYLKSTPSAVKKDFEDNLSYFNTLFSKRNSKFPGFSSARLPGDGRFLKNYVDMIKGQEKLSHVSWDIEFSYNGRFTHLDKLDWQGVKGVACSHSGFPTANNIILMHDSHWKGRIDLFRALIKKLKTRCNITSLKPLPRGNHKINYATP